ncbi:hypothetical protein D3C87_1483940 [compost metagenome]
MQPVTTGGKKRRKRPTNGAASMVKIPAPITAPQTPAKPTSGLLPMAMTGPTLLKATPWRIGRRTPNFQKPTVCRIVAMPEQNSVVLISTTVSAWDIFKALATINGTAMAPMYETAMCCKPRVSICRTDNTWSTGWRVETGFEGVVADDMGKHL